MGPRVIHVGKRVRVESNDSIYDGIIQSVSKSGIVRVGWVRNGTPCHAEWTKDAVYWVLQNRQPLKAY
jgi:hypothetical protein